MLGLLESKLYSLPAEITKGYPELVHISLNDLNPEIAKINSSGNANGNSSKSYNPRGADGNGNPLSANDGKIQGEAAEAQREEVKEVSKELTANERLVKFIEENEDITTYYNMLK
jgi:hypothetical protein